MLKKLLFACSLPFICLSASAKEQYQINAKNLKEQDGVVIATGDAIVFSKSYFITAEKIIFNKNDNTIELFEDVTVLKDNKLQMLTDYAFFNMDEDGINQDNSFMFNADSNLWLDSQASSKSGDIMTLKGSITSSCNCEDPFWKIKFSNATYNAKDEWVSSYNARLYIKDIPVFYIPYFGYPTDSRRRTGLLFPTVGYSRNEGAIYKQPIYIAPAPNYDIEIIPQIRSNRGYGAHGYLRYADSPYSTLKVESGIFVEDGNYKDENNLQNNKHYGLALDYRRTNLFANEQKDHQDGLYANFNWLNDVDYAQIEPTRFGYNNTRRVESKLNYFYKTPEYYAGLYLRHYNEITLENNDNTIQQLPQIQAHKFLDNIFFDNLTYNVDLLYTNFERVRGLNVQQYDLNIPIQFGFSLFDDYLNVVFREELLLSRLNYSSGLSENFEDGTFIQNRHVAEISTDLLKPYDSFIHTLNLSSQISIPNTIEQKGDLFTINNNNTELSPFPVQEDNKEISFSLNQSFYNKSDLNQIVNHKISQAILYDNNNNSSLGELENELTVYYPFGTIYNRLAYNHQDKVLAETSSGFDFSYDWFALDASHFKSQRTSTTTRDNLESYRMAATAKFSNRYWLTYQVNYDLLNNTKNREGILATINDACWRFNVSYIKDIETINTTRGIETKSQNVIYFQLELKPLGGINQSYKISG